ncbi:MAG: magnesium transporter CorA family protein [Clostridia bacterium]|nr:magnesium transporter CorA family protein [Clostridia bacterium]
MLTVFRSEDGQVVRQDSIEPGCWVHLCRPDDDEIARVESELSIDRDYLLAALDDEESPRVDSEEGDTLIIIDIPFVENSGKTLSYSTLPLGIIHRDDIILTVCLRDTSLIDMFAEGKVKGFSTNKKTRFILQLLQRNAARFLQYLKQIDKSSVAIEAELHKSMQNRELIQMLGLEKSLVYFSTSLTSNERVLKKLLRLDFIQRYPDDTELLEDVLVENEQAISMCSIYRDILSGTMDAFASIISNNLNIIMKLLASITIVLSIPTIVASFFGMNTGVPWEGSITGFYIAMGIAFGGSLITALILWLKKMF